VGLFGRSKGERASQEAEDAADAAVADEATDRVDEQGSGEGSSDRSNGPWDADEDYPDVPRVDLGGLLLPQSQQIRIQVQADPSSGAVSQLSVLSEGSAVQIQPYAAPRKAGMWDEIRQQIVSSINSSGGLVEQVEGPYGTEVRAQVAGAEGKAQPARFCGIDGPRWFVRLVFLGKAARDVQAAGVLDDIVRGMVVVRGDEAMPMGNSIALRVPQNPESESESAVDESASADASDSSAPARPSLTLPVRGPEITETR
jgi:Protein of unknown function (DUF3710).